MTKVAEIERIRWAHFHDGVAVRELARTFHKSRKTIRRALEDPGPWTYRRARPRSKPVMDAIAPVIASWLEEDLSSAAQAAAHGEADLGAVGGRARLRRRGDDGAAVGA